MNMQCRLSRQCWAVLLLLALLGRVDRAPGQEQPPVNKQRDEEHRQLIIGTWEDDYQGKRTMTIRTNGTATMVVELRGAKAVLYASRLEFDMIWSVEQGLLKKRTTGGKPARRVKLILKSMGDRVAEPILELTKDRLVLLDENGKTKYTWMRVAKREEPAKAVP